MFIRDERELAKLGCVLDPEDPTRAIPIQKGQTDLFGKSIPELEVIAKNEHDILLGIERQSVTSYWRLGEALSVLREKHNIPHREWMKYVDDLGINYTRAKRALRIKQRYEKPEDCYGKSIDDALDYEQREEHHQTPTPKPVGAKPAMHFQHDEHQEEEEIESTDENEDENESHNPAIADIESIHKDGDYEPIVADLTPEEIGAATNFIAVVGNCERAAHALVTKCIENGDRKIVIGFFETVVQSLRSALEWSDIDQILITTKAKEHGVKVITL